MSFLDQVGKDGFSITPSDTVALEQTADAIYVGSAGDVAIQTSSGSNLIFSGAQAGSVLPIRANYVYATGTTASSLVAITYTKVR